MTQKQSRQSDDQRYFGVPEPARGHGVSLLPYSETARRLFTYLFCVNEKSEASGSLPPVRVVRRIWAAIIEKVIPFPP